jgi:ribosome-binding ATPase YchF (GTP1/OBG family)
VKDVGLVGVAYSGKSTLFIALTRAGSHGGQANVAVVSVPDERLAVLTDMERSAKTVAAQVRFVDVPGGVASAQGIAKLREVDALAVVLRCFGADATPLDDLSSVRSELLLADLAVIEVRAQRQIPRTDC